MQPKLYSDTIYMPTADGVHLRNNRSNLTIKGGTIYRWLEQLVPYFNGQHSLEEITNGLDASRKAMVTDLVETLFKQHFLADVSLDQPHGLSQAELDTYASEIAFIEAFQPSAARRFELFRQTRLLIIGAGITGQALIRSSLHSGIKHLSIIRITEEEATPGIYSAIDDARLLLPHDTSQRIQELEAPCWDDETAIRRTIQPFDAILHISDHPMLARARLLNTLCVEQQKILLQACFVDDQAWVGPLVKPDIAGCWECAWRRLQSNIHEEAQLSSYAFHDQATLAPNRWFAFPVAAIAANQLVLELFKTVTQVGSQENVGKIVSIDLETLTSRDHAFLPHPHCQACQHPSAPTEAAFLAQVEQIQHQEPINIETFSKQVIRCFDHRCGIFTSIGEDNYEQVPLSVCKVEISNPMLLKNHIQTQRVIAVGSNFKTVRQRVTQRACEEYAAHIVDTRRLVTQKMPFALPLEGFLTTSSYAPIESWSWALDLHTQQPRLVPAPLAFPSLSPEQPTMTNEHGIGSGMSWSEAVCQALLDWAHYLTIVQLSDTRHLYPKVDLFSIPLTTEGDHLLHLLETVEALPDVYDVTGSFCIPTFALCTEAQTIAYSSHYNAIQAVSMGLELALQQYQSNYAQQPDYATEPVPPFPTSLRSNNRQYQQMPDITVPQEWSRRQEWLLQKLQESGWRAVAVPLNHDPALVEVLPFLVRVLLVREEKRSKG